MAQDGKLVKDGFRRFLDTKFKDFYDDEFLSAAALNPELFLGAKKDFIFLNFVYLGVHRFDLSNL